MNPDHPTERAVRRCSTVQVVPTKRILLIATEPQPNRPDLDPLILSIHSPLLSYSVPQWLSLSFIYGNNEIDTGNSIRNYLQNIWSIIRWLKSVKCWNDKKLGKEDYRKNIPRFRKVSVFSVDQANNRSQSRKIYNTWWYRIFREFINSLALIWESVLRLLTKYGMHL